MMVVRSSQQMKFVATTSKQIVVVLLVFLSFHTQAAAQQTECNQRSLVSAQSEINKFTRKGRKVVRRTQRLLSRMTGNKRAGKRRLRRARNAADQSFAINASLPPVVRTSCSENLLCTRQDLSSLTDELAGNALHVCDQAIENLKRLRHKTSVNRRLLRRLRRRAIRFYRKSMTAIKTVPSTHSQCVSSV